jgi:chemotaxis protein MotB
LTRFPNPSRWPLLLGLVFPLSVWAAGTVPAQQAELDKLRGYLSQVSRQVERLRADLKQADQRNRLQSKLIDRLEQGLKRPHPCASPEAARLRQAFFAELRKRLPASPIYQVRADRVVVPADLVFIFSKARLGAEGEARLMGLADALGEAIRALPTDRPWRLRIEGHTDPRPLKDTREFATNWELSAARATEVLRFLLRHGVPRRHLEAVALADTRPRSRRHDRSAYRLDRRIELHLELSGN